MPLYYMLSREGLKIVGQYHHYDKSYLKTYPSPATLISSGSFQHEADIVELASLEALASSPELTITFVGEQAAQLQAVRSDRHIEVLTPDYLVRYVSKDNTETIYTEFERTNKSTRAMLCKIERYDRNLEQDERKNTALRLIFDNERMERSFWLHILLDKPKLARNIRILTTNLSLVQTSESFLEPVYASENCIKLKREGHLVVTVTGRVKMLRIV